MSEAAAPLLDAPPLRRYGRPSLEYGPSPAAATAFVQTVEGAYLVRLLTLYCRLTPDANAANREVTLEYRNAADERFYLAGAAVTVPASDVTDFMFSAYLGEATWEVDSTVLVPIAPLILEPTFDFRVNVLNAQVGDTLTRIRFVWERFFTDSPVS
jgi:hypothetical protein